MTTCIPRKKSRYQPAVTCTYIIVLSLISIISNFELIHNERLTSGGLTCLSVLSVLCLFKLFKVGLYVFSDQGQYCLEANNELADERPCATPNTDPDVACCCPTCCNHGCSDNEMASVVTATADGQIGADSGKTAQNDEPLWPKGPEQKPRSSDGGIS